jgi:hypothetical protein
MFKKMISMFVISFALLIFGTITQSYAAENKTGVINHSAYHGPMNIAAAQKCKRNQNLAAQKESFKKGDLVFVEWHKKWFKASVLKTNNTKKSYYINYDNWSHSWDEWVGLNRIMYRACE